MSNWFKYSFVNLVEQDCRGMAEWRRDHAGRSQWESHVGGGHGVGKGLYLRDVRLGSWVERRGSGGCSCFGNQGLELCCHYVDEEIIGAGRLGEGR